MKKILTIASVLFSTVMFAAGTADEPTSLSGAAVIKTSSSTFKLIYKSDSESDVKVTIFDSSDELVFTDKVRRTTGFARPYSFENLAPGNYRVVIEDNSGSTTRNISTLPTTTSKLVNLLKLKSAEGKYLLTIGGRGAESLTLNIYDGQRLIHSEMKEVTGDYAQVYNLSQVKGVPSFEILHQNGTAEILEY